MFTLYKPSMLPATASTAFLSALVSRTTVSFSSSASSAMNVPVSATKPVVPHEPRLDPKTTRLTHEFRSVSLPKPLTALQSEYPLFGVLAPGLHQNPQVDALEQIVVVDDGREIRDGVAERGVV